MDIPAKVRKNFIRKRTFLIKQLCRCKVIYFSKLSLTIILLDLKLFRVSNLLFITRAFRGKRSKYKFGFFFFFWVQSQNAVPLQRIRIRPSIPKSSWLRRYVKVRRVTKSVCKLNTKRVTLNSYTTREEVFVEFFCEGVSKDI